MYRYTYLRVIQYYLSAENTTYAINRIIIKIQIPIHSTFKSLTFIRRNELSIY